MSGPIAVDDIAADTVSIGGITVTGGVVILNDSGVLPLQVGGFRAGPEGGSGAFATYQLGGIGPLPVHTVEGVYGTLMLAASGAWQYTLRSDDPDTSALPFKQSATDVFTYRVEDPNGDTDLGQLTINVLGSNTAPEIISGGGAPKAPVNVHEGSKFVSVVEATDADGDALTYSIAGGADAGKFRINAATGKLKFKAKPDFEQPEDAGHNNVYKVVVAVSDGTATDTQKIAVRVHDVGARVIGSAGIDVVYSGWFGRATSRDDVIKGRGGCDVLSGGRGDDTIHGGSGRDVLHGGKGHDLLRGGRGDDVFVFAERPSPRHADTIEDFRHNHDTLLLHASDFRGVGWGGLGNGAFHAADGATAAHDGSDRIVYDSASGALYYDPDGQGGDGAIHFATLEGAPRLDAGDFLIV